jgi:hypothetical protein
MHESPSPAHALFDADEVRDVLEATFYRAPAAPKKTRAAKPTKVSSRPPKPDHYDVICISMYTEDLASLDAKVEALKQRGHRRMTRSALIRYALERLAVEDVPRPAF